MAEFDLVMRGGTIVDGTGGRAVRGRRRGQGRQDRAGRASRGRRRRGDRRQRQAGHAGLRRHPHPLRRADHLGRPLPPSSGHGVTTVVMGNCGVGFAPCRPEQRELMISVMEGVEDIPGIVMAEGVPWNWGPFPNISISSTSAAPTSTSRRRCRTRRCASLSWAGAAPTASPRWRAIWRRWRRS